MVRQPVSRGLAVFADAWLSAWLAGISADLRENGSASEVVLHDDALYNYKSTTLRLYFTFMARINTLSFIEIGQRLLGKVVFADRHQTMDGRTTHDRQQVELAVINTKICSAWHSNVIRPGITQSSDSGLEGT